MDVVPGETAIMKQGSKAKALRILRQNDPDPTSYPARQPENATKQNKSKSENGRKKCSIVQFVCMYHTGAHMQDL